MSEKAKKVKAADAEFGEWYDAGGIRLRCGSWGCMNAGRRLFVINGEMGQLIDGDTELTHLPDCTGWDWEPPQEPDTSLAASIEFVSDWNEAEKVDQEYYPLADNLERVIEAARKWDGLKSGGSVASVTTKHAEPFVIEDGSDPDGVGEGWMLCDHREAEQYTHIANAENKSRINGEICGWLPVCGHDFSGKSSTFLFRRRIDADKPLVAASPGEIRVAEGQAETQPRERSEDPQDKPTEKPKRREWWLWRNAFSGELVAVDDTAPEWMIKGGTRVREVLPSDPPPEWTSRLIELCEEITSGLCLSDLALVRADIAEHLRKRGEK